MNITRRLISDPVKKSVFHLIHPVVVAIALIPMNDERSPLQGLECVSVLSSIKRNKSISSQRTVNRLS